MDWDLDYTEWRDSNPYGKKINDFIDKYTEWMVYLRVDNRFRCPDHFSGPENSKLSFGSPDCSYDCWGLGTAVSGQIVPAKLSRGRNAEVGSLDGTIKEMPGYMDKFQDVIHFPRLVLPQVNDLVLGVEWNIPNQAIPKSSYPRPVRIHSIYIIRQINSYFQREISHFSCGSESLEVVKNWADSLLLSKLNSLELIPGVKDSWQQDFYW